MLHGCVHSISVSTSVLSHQVEDGVAIVITTSMYVCMYVCHLSGLSHCYTCYIQDIPVYHNTHFLSFVPPILVHFASMLIISHLLTFCGNGAFDHVHMHSDTHTHTHTHTLDADIVC